jgi:hypothetical protein
LLYRLDSDLKGRQNSLISEVPMKAQRHMFAIVGTLLLLTATPAAAQDSPRVLVEYIDPLSGAWVVVTPSVQNARVAEWLKQLEGVTDSTALPGFVAPFKSEGLLAAGFKGGTDMLSVGPPLVADYYSLTKRRMISVDAKVDPQQAVQWSIAASATDNVGALVELLNANHPQGLVGIVLPAFDGRRQVAMIRYGVVARSPQVEDKGGVTMSFSKMKEGDLESALKQLRTVKDPAGLTALATAYLDHGYKTARITWNAPQQGVFSVTVWANTR